MELTTESQTNHREWYIKRRIWIAIFPNSVEPYSGPSVDIMDTS
jgi:hypothetical protein